MSVCIVLNYNLHAAVKLPKLRIELEDHAGIIIIILSTTVVMITNYENHTHNYKFVTVSWIWPWNKRTSVH